MSLETMETKVKIFPLDGIDYLVREASEDSWVAYQTALFNSCDRNEEGILIPKESTVHLRRILVGPNIFKIAGVEKRRVPLTSEEIKELPSRFVRTVFNWIQKESETTEENVGNSPSAGQEPSA